MSGNIPLVSCGSNLHKLEPQLNRGIRLLSKIRHYLSNFSEETYISPSSAVISFMFTKFGEDKKVF